MSRWSSVERLVALLAEAHLPPVVQDAEPDPHGLVAAATDHGEVGQLDGRFHLDDPARLLRAAGAPVLLHHVHAGHHRAPVLRQHAAHVTPTSAVAAGEHLHGVVALDLRRHYSTSGASEMIRM